MRARAAATVIDDDGTPVAVSVQAVSEHTHHGQMRLAVLGHPIAHSKSPALHAAAYRELGLDWRYQRFSVQTHQLSGFLGSCGPEWLGFSLTMPLKEEAHRRALSLDRVAQLSGVVNTLLRLPQPRSEPGWAGFNTDVGGLTAALTRAKLDPSHTVVLGAGATAVSAVLAAQRAGADRVTVCARRAAAARALAERFDVFAAPLDAARGPLCSPADATLLVSTLPAQAGATIPLPELLAAVPLYDVAYHPLPLGNDSEDPAITEGDATDTADTRREPLTPAEPSSPLVSRWRARGGEAHTGLSMLVEQALLQIRVFVHGSVDVPLTQEPSVRTAMYDALTGTPFPGDG